jgi:hypothetical protein
MDPICADVLEPQSDWISLPVCRVGGGMMPGVNLDDSAALLDRMDRRD